MPSPGPDFDLRFVFDGGTRRFSNARGEGMADSFVTQSPERTEHLWSGTLVLEPGR